jgi:uncharacterized membrane protein YqaE (UPF0057 family)
MKHFFTLLLLALIFSSCSSAYQTAFAPTKKAQVLAAEAAPQMGDQGLIAEHEAMQTTEVVASATTAAAATLPAAGGEFNIRENLTKKEQRQLKKETRKLVWQQAKQSLFRKNTASDNTLLLAIIAIFIPPLAMYLHEGDINNKFWLSLVLTILGFLPGVIYTLVVILSNN